MSNIQHESGEILFQLRKINESRLENKIITKSTFGCYKANINRIALVYPELYEINHEILLDIQKQLLEKFNRNTVAMTLKYFKNYLLHLNIQVSFKSVRTAEYETHRTFLNPDEVVKLTRYYEMIREGMDFKERLAIVRFLLACHTGLRIGDLIQHFDSNQIDFYINDEFIILSPEKSKRVGKIISIPANKSVLHLLDELKQLRLIYHVRQNRSYTSKLVSSISYRIGLKKHVTMHVGRHSFATNFLRAGGRIEVLQKLLGHSNIQITMKYVGITNQDKIAGLADLESLYQLQ